MQIIRLYDALILYSMICMLHVHTGRLCTHVIDSIIILEPYHRIRSRPVKARSMESNATRLLKEMELPLLPTAHDNGGTEVCGHVVFINSLHALRLRSMIQSGNSLQWL